MDRLEDNRLHGAREKEARDDYRRPSGNVTVDGRRLTRDIRYFTFFRLHRRGNKIRLFVVLLLRFLRFRPVRPNVIPSRGSPRFS
ncbi:hypothetical protein NHX12_021636 [Muraenolepis orangiensis]|uniref:Uncharacterized protein n=1 Tax=Muraenolepis orangiensis TaxID=630683 RepID=A0A9Q0IW87_9TELE|nr:hypothetical protein NHX12_021636 [Muraenolepis orangiensis]